MNEMNTTSQCLNAAEEILKETSKTEKNSHPNNENSYWKTTVADIEGFTQITDSLNNHQNTQLSKKKFESNLKKDD